VLNSTTAFGSGKPVEVDGTSARAGCVAIPTENTHGYEVIVDGAIQACAQTLADYLATY